MAYTFTAYFMRGTKRLNLDTPPFYLTPEFQPPSITETPNLASGTSANQYGGSKLISKKVESSFYGFSVRVKGTTSARIDAEIQRLDRFINSATTAEPVYFCWKSNDNVGFEPTIGWWGSTFRAQIIHGSARRSMAFTDSNIHSVLEYADVSLLINSPEWPRRLLASALGGVIEDTIGTADGSSRGIVVPEGTTNKMTNPVFSHGTPLNGWSTGASSVSSVNTDEQFILWGSNSAKITRIASVAWAFTQSINVGNTNTHAFSAYVKLPDSGAVSIIKVRLYYNTELTTAYQSLGDGWYMLTATASGIASATATGITVEAVGVTVYLAGYQCEEKSISTPLCHGGLLGCAWTGTAHASTSTRTSAVLKAATADGFNIAEGTYTFSIKIPYYANTIGDNRTVFDVETNRVRLTYVAADDKFVFSDNTNNASSSALTWAAGAEYTIHCVYGSAGLKLYINGALDGSNATYTPAAAGSYVFFGTSVTPDASTDILFRGITFSPRAMTAAEVLADYTARASAAAADLRIDWLTYLWTKDGDNVFDQYTLSTTHADWGIVGSVPGSLPCKVTANIVKSAGADAIWIGVNGWNTFINPGDGFADWNGTALAGAVSGEVKQKTVDTTEDYLPGTSGDYISISDEGYKRGIENKPVWAFLSLKDLGSTGLKVKFRHRVYGGGGIADTDWLTLVATAGLTQYMFGPIIIPQYPGDDIATMTNTALFAFRCIRPSGSDAVQTDFFRLIHGRMTKLQPATGTATIRFYYDTDRAYGVDTGPGYTEIIYPEFDDLMFDPNVLNHVVVVSGDQGGSTAITVTVTFDKLLIAPRWALA